MEIVKSKSLLENFTALPLEGQKEAMHFIEFLKARYESPKPRKVDSTKQTKDESFIGIWSDREDMQDSGEWVRDLRQKEWS